MKKSIASLSLGVFFVFASAAWANPDWSSGYPKSGPTSGTIVVKGTVTLNCTQQTTGTVTVRTWPVDGGAETSQDFTITSGQTGMITWGELTVTGLTPAQNYNVVVEIGVIDNSMATYNLSPDPGTATATPNSGGSPGRP